MNNYIKWVTHTVVIVTMYKMGNYFLDMQYLLISNMSEIVSIKIVQYTQEALPHNVYMRLNIIDILVLF